MDTLHILWQPWPGSGRGSMGAVFICVAVLMGLTTWAWWRGRGTRPARFGIVWVMRLIWIAMLGVILAGPSEQRPVAAPTAPMKPALTLAIDTSASMAQQDMADQPRYAVALDHWLDPAQLQSLARTHRVRLVAFDDKPRPVTRQQLTADAFVGQTSRVGQSLTQIVEEVATSAKADGHDQAREKLPGGDVVVISDGRDTDDAPLTGVADRAQARQVRVHTVTLGQPHGPPDLAVRVGVQEPYGFKGDPMHLVVRITRSGSSPDTALLRWTEGQTIHTRPVTFGDKTSVRMTIPIHPPDVGQHEYIVSVDAWPGELEVRNNRQSVWASVVDARLKVLIVEGQPDWDTTYLAGALERDDRLSVARFTQVSSGHQQKIVTRLAPEQAMLPTSLTDWLGYDVVILGRSVERLLSRDALKTLPAYVREHNGQLVLARGQPVTSDQARQALRVLNPRGKPLTRPLKADFLEAMTEDVAGPLSGPSPGAGSGQTPAKADGHDRAWAVQMPYGSGRVVAVWEPGLWRRRLAQGSAPTRSLGFDGFWSSLVRQLAMGSLFVPGQSVTLGMSLPQVPTGDAVTLWLGYRLPRAVGEPAPQVTVRDPHGRPTTLTLSRARQNAMHWRTTFIPSAPGRYRVTWEAPRPSSLTAQATFEAYTLNREQLRAQANPAAMEQLATSTGGQVLDPYQPRALLDQLGRQPTPTAKAPAPVRYLWDRGDVLFIVLMWAGAFWQLGQSREGFG